jgi:trimethylamine--corrinoid protein Co-methyltransferase
MIDTDPTPVPHAMRGIRRHMFLHEGGLQASFEKIVVDVEMLQMMAETITAQPLDDIDTILKTIAGVPPGGHFFDSPDTLQRYRTAFYEPIVSDWRNHGAWTEAGAPTAFEHATRIWQGKLASFTPPPFDVEIAAELDAFVKRRKIELMR